MVLKFLPAVRNGEQDTLGIPVETGGIMRNVPALIFFMAVGLLAVSVPLVAHHGNAAFDPASVTVTGTVTEFTWGNPHCFVRFDVKDKDGGIVHWVAETSNPSDMIDRGWTKNSLKPGYEATITMQIVKSGKPIGRVQKIVLADGKVLSTTLPPAPKTN
jgi:hypothetical protein